MTSEIMLYINVKGLNEMAPSNTTINTYTCEYSVCKVCVYKYIYIYIYTHTHTLAYKYAYINYKYN